MPPQRRGRARIRLTPTHASANPPTQTDLPAQTPTLPEEPLLPLAIFASTPSPGREITTEPATPASPTLHTRAWALRRERSINIPHSVLHYNRTENGLQTWHWHVYLSSSAYGSVYL